MMLLHGFGLGTIGADPLAIPEQYRQVKVLELPAGWPATNAVQIGKTIILEQKAIGLIHGHPTDLVLFQLSLVVAVL